MTRYMVFNKRTLRYNTTIHGHNTLYMSVKAAKRAASVLNRSPEKGPMLDWITLEVQIGPDNFRRIY